MEVIGPVGIDEVHLLANNPAPAPEAPQPAPTPAPTPAPPPEAPPAEAAPAESAPAPAAPEVDRLTLLERQLEDSNRRLRESEENAAFWAQQARSVPGQQPQQPAAQQPKQFTKEQLSERMTEGDISVLEEIGFLKTGQVPTRQEIQQMIEERVAQAANAASTSQELTSEYPWLNDPKSREYAEARDILRTKYAHIAKTHPAEALTLAASAVQLRIDKAQIEAERRSVKGSALGAGTGPGAPARQPTPFALTPKQQEYARKHRIPEKEFAEEVRALQHA